MLARKAANECLLPSEETAEILFMYGGIGWGKDNSSLRSERPSGSSVPSRETLTAIVRICSFVR